MRQTLFLALLVGTLLAVLSFGIVASNYILNNENIQIAFRNNIMLLILATGVSGSLGLMIALLVDRISKWEVFIKSLIFLPITISVLGASVIWGFIYFMRVLMAGSVKG